MNTERATIKVVHKASKEEQLIWLDKFNPEIHEKVGAKKPAAKKKAAKK